MNKTKSTKRDLPAKQRTELLTTLKARFEQNMDRHKGLEWTKVQARLEANPEKLWSLNEMELTGGEPDVVGLTRRRANTFFTIVLRKVLKAGEVFATIVKRSTRGKKTNQKIALSTWRRRWALSF